MCKPPTDDFNSQEQTLVSLIRQAVPAQKIYMLGKKLPHQLTATVFMHDAAARCRPVHYWLLVLVDKAGGLTNNYIQDKIENNCRRLAAVTVIVLDTRQFGNWLNGGHCFACTVVKAAPLLYGNGDISLPVTGATNYNAAESTEARCRQGIDRVTEFMTGAELYRLRQQYKMAAFMLHQAAEQGLLTVFKKATGLYLRTHNIDKLLRYCAIVNDQIPNVFSAESEADTRLLRLLQKAYIDSRYREDFCISSADVATITERIKIVQELLEQTG